MASEMQLDKVMSAMTPIAEDEDEERESMISLEFLQAPSEEQIIEPPVILQDEYDTDLDMDADIEEFDATGRQLYLDACKHLSVVPASYFLRNMLEPALVMKYHGLGALGVKAIALALQNNTQLLSLDIEGNAIGGSGGTYVAHMLKENIYMTDINLAYNNLGSVGAARICDMLANNTTLQGLNLASNTFTDADATYFVEAFIENRRLQVLNLSHNKFGEKAAFLLGNAIAENDTLEELDLSWNYFRKKGAVEICDGIKNNARLKRVNLAFNGLGLEGGMAVAGMIKGNNLLLEIDVSCNRIPSSVAIAISKSLEVNDTLKVFKIGSNPLGPIGIMELLKGISTDCSVIQTLDMSGIEVDKAFIAAKDSFLETRKNVGIIHGRVLLDYIIKGPPKTKWKMLLTSDPEDIDCGSILTIIKAYCTDKNIHLKEQLLNADKNNDNRMPISDIIVAMQMAGISLLGDDAAKLSIILHKLETPEIDFSIFLKD